MRLGRVPTLAQIIGAKAPQDIDGVSFLPTLWGKASRCGTKRSTGSSTRAVSRRHFGWGRYKAVRKKGRLALYDLQTDLGERNDIAGANPDLAVRIGAADGRVAYGKRALAGTGRQVAAWPAASTDAQCAVASRMSWSSWAASFSRGGSIFHPGQVVTHLARGRQGRRLGEDGGGPKVADEVRVDEGLEFVHAGDHRFSQTGNAMARRWRGRRACSRVASSRPGGRAQSGRPACPRFISRVNCSPAPARSASFA